ncbi:hypothetical protein HPP92_028683 [Vanilla planifolia]|uniref:Gamma tubulin complex component protein N-terminal domain-containing protein n=1 Tax=Vanilla planifolia TaxID=51239 RepID=A0A835PA33_VANPL|nr:hypothetical protein HPP92_028683 [Vanilla planifolia]
MPYFSPADMEDPATVDLVKELVLRLLSSGGRPTPTVSDPSCAAAVRYALRLLSSSMSPSLLPDELSLVESIKRRLAVSGRSPAALAFADLHSKLSARAPQLNRWALLYLLNYLSLDRRRASKSASGCLPFLPLQYAHSSRPSLASGPGGPAGGGVLLVAKDPENIREIALREYADLVMEDNEVTESALVRDVIYASQGIDGRYIRFDRSTDGYDLPQSLKVVRPTRTIVRCLCELGWLFRKVRGYISENTLDRQLEVGTVCQAFCSALQEELSDYYKLLAVLESQSSNPIPSAGSDYGGGTGNYLSLRRLAVWLAEPTVRMRLMAVLVDGCRELKGGAMAGAIHGHAQHGDLLVQEFMARLLRRVCSPLFEMVRTWVLEGELEDVFLSSLY